MRKADSLEADVGAEAYDVVLALCAGEAEQVGVAVVYLVVCEFEIDSRGVLIADTEAPFRRVVKIIRVVVDVREADEAAPLVVPLLVGLHEPPL